MQPQIPQGKTAGKWGRGSPELPSSPSIDHPDPDLQYGISSSTAASAEGGFRTHPTPPHPLEALFALLGITQVENYSHVVLAGVCQALIHTRSERPLLPGYMVITEQEGCEAGCPRF